MRNNVVDERMNEVLSHGIVEVDGEKIAYTFRRCFRKPETNEWHNCLEASYHGSHIVIDAHDSGLQYALDLLRHHIAFKKPKKKNTGGGALQP